MSQSSFATSFATSYEDEGVNRFGGLRVLPDLLFGSSDVCFGVLTASRDFLFGSADDWRCESDFEC